MDYHDQPPPGRSSQPAAHLTPPAQFEWTRKPGTGPGLGVLGRLTGAKVVELGCGSGHNLACLARSHRLTATGVDHDAAKIQRARACYGRLPGLRFTCSDAAQFLDQAAPGSADLVLSIFGAFSFADPLPLLTATASLLRPGGLLAITLRASDEHDQVIVLRRR